LRVGKRPVGAGAEQEIVVVLAELGLGELGVVE